MHRHGAEDERPGRGDERRPLASAARWPSRGAANGAWAQDRPQSRPARARASAAPIAVSGSATPRFTAAKTNSAWPATPKAASSTWPIGQNTVSESAEQRQVGDRPPASCAGATCTSAANAAS